MAAATPHYLEEHRALSRKINGDDYTTADKYLIEGIRDHAAQLGFTEEEMDLDLAPAAAAAFEILSDTTFDESGWGDLETGNFC